MRTKQVEASFPSVDARYVRFKALQFGPLPAWHESAGSESHIFIDEIEVK